MSKNNNLNTNMPIYEILSLADALSRLNRGMAQKKEAIRLISDALHAGVRQLLFEKQLTILKAVIEGGSFQTGSNVGNGIIKTDGLKTDKDFGRILKAVYVMTGGAERTKDNTFILAAEKSIIRFDSKAKTIDLSSRNIPHKVFLRLQIEYASLHGSTYEDMQPREPEKPYTMEMVRAFMRRCEAQKKNWSDADRRELQEFIDRNNHVNHPVIELEPASSITRPVARFDGKPKLEAAPRQAAAAM